MDIKEEQLDSGITKIKLSGRMDSEGVSRIQSEIAGMTAAPRMSIMVDMSDVPYMSSIGIRTLLMNAKGVSRRGGKFVLLSLQPNVRNMLEISGIDQLIGIYNSQDEALANIKI